MNLSLRLLNLPGDGADVTREPKSTPALHGDARRRRRQPRESARILIVDDEPAVAELIRDHLLRHGYTVDLAFSADEALAAIRQVRRDLVLLDSAMPQIDGVEALGRIRALDASVAVIIVDGRAERSLDREPSNPGAGGPAMNPTASPALARPPGPALPRRGAKTHRRSDRLAELA